MYVSFFSLSSSYFSLSLSLCLSFYLFLSLKHTYSSSAVIAVPSTMFWSISRVPTPQSQYSNTRSFLSRRPTCSLRLQHQLSLHFISPFKRCFRNKRTTLCFPKSPMLMYCNKKGTTALFENISAIRAFILSRESGVCFCI